MRPVTRAPVTPADLIASIRESYSADEFDVDVWAAREGISSEALLHAAAYMISVVKRVREISGPVEDDVAIGGHQLAAFSLGWDAHKALRGERRELDEQLVTQARAFQRAFAEYVGVRELGEEDPLLIVLRSRGWAVFEAIRRRDDEGAR